MPTAVRDSPSYPSFIIFVTNSNFHDLLRLRAGRHAQTLLRLGAGQQRNAGIAQREAILAAELPDFIAAGAVEAVIRRMRTPFIPTLITQHHEAHRERDTPDHVSAIMYAGSTVATAPKLPRGPFGFSACIAHTSTP